ncbi:toxin glutamine deamidase domain-containing protein [Streptomyces sp. NBC_01465]|uniref:toxin glutamine deamidase domain-containing protein n=1 Tax=Streptomyces sp. NBC_01465 TaxID=2903878 RepID=UPI002E31EE07|nr:toxin glutamine deamidase domain-containing protein [Streptomyces sp. NBC_01465]
MMLPGELEWVLEMLGFDWPTADEDKMMESATVWRKFAQDVRALHDASNTAASTVLKANSGDSIDKFRTTYEKFGGGSGGDGHLANAAMAAEIIAGVMDAAAYLVIACKVAVIVQLIALAIEIIAAQAAAPFTFGLSEVGALGATAATKMIVRRVLKELKDALIDAIIEAVKEPATSAIEAMISDLIAQTLNVSFGAQQGYNLGRTAGAGKDAAWDAIKQTPQTLAEGVRDSLGEKAGHRARHAVDSRLDGSHGADGDSGSGSGSGSNSSSGDGDSSTDSGSDSSDSGSDSGSDSQTNSGDGNTNSNSNSTVSADANVNTGNGTNIGGGISADTGSGVDASADVGSRTAPDPGSSTPDSASPQSGPLPSNSSPDSTLSDFDDQGPSPANPGPSNAPSSDGGTDASTASPSSGPSGNGGLPSSPTPHSAPTPSGSTDSGSSSNNGRGISMSVDNLAATAPAPQHHATPTPSASDGPSTSRPDGNSSIPTSPNTQGSGSSTPTSRPSAGPSPSGRTPSPSSPSPSTSSPSTPSHTTSPGSSGPRSTPSSPSSPSGPAASTPSSTSPSTPRGSAPTSTSTAPSSNSPTTNPSSTSSTPPSSTPSTSSTPSRATPPSSGTPDAGPGSNSPRPTPSTPGTPGTPPGSTPTPGNNTPGTPNTPHTPNASPQNPSPSPASTPATTPSGQHNTTVPAPVHTVAHTAPATPTAHIPQQQSDSPAHQAPTSSTRNTTPPGGVTHPTHAEQSALDDSVPRDADGNPTRPPDPADGPWVQRINGEGADAPGRNNNCVDVALSTADTFSGNPTAAAARTPDTGPDGLPSDRGETNGRNRIENALGARFSDMGDGRSAFNRLENTLRDSGHGSQAVIITQDANGRAHAWNAVNHNGRITYIDAQTGRTSQTPLHDGKNGVFAVPLDANRRPVTPTATPASTSAAKTPTASQPNHEPATAPAEGRRAPEAPAGSPAQADDGTDQPAGDPQQGEHPRLVDPETVDSTPHHGMYPMPDQQNLRQSNDVRQVDMDHVHQQLNAWMEPHPVHHEDGTQTTRIPLVDAMQASTPPSTADGSPPPVTLRQSDLNRILPGFSDLHPGEQGAVVASLARLSHKFHAAHAVGASPEHTPGQRSHGAEAHGKVRNWPAKTREEQELKDAISAEFKNSGIAGALRDSGEHRPDFSGRNYAVLELHDPTTGETSYLVDSSYPNVDGENGKHSESNILDYLDQVNSGRGEDSQYKPIGLFTDREPCGRGQGYANCSRALSERVPGVDVYYGTGYRKNARVDESEEYAGVNHKAEYDRDIARNLAALGKVWVRAMAEGGLRTPA